MEYFENGGWLQTNISRLYSNQQRHYFDYKILTSDKNHGMYM